MAATAKEPMTIIIRLRVLTPGRRALLSQIATRIQSRQPRRASRAPQFRQKLELLIVGASRSEARGLYSIGSRAWGNYKSLVLAAERPNVYSFSRKNRLSGAVARPSLNRSLVANIACEI